MRAMTAQPLDNPIWSALRTVHAHLAVTDGPVARYPAAVAPFVSASDAAVDVAERLERLVERGEHLYFVGQVPKLGAGWSVEMHAPLPQMVCWSPSQVRDGPETIAMTDAHVPDMLALTALVFPGFFRARTIDMGRYIGIYHGKQLAAMAGERMRMEGYTEISAVCTHPDYVGRGYAQRLVAMVSNAAFERGSTPFLHVYRHNTRAMAVYERLGFAVRTDVALCSVTRQ
jgi:ribosomal protein S18 acetylase RimI-like enzyme